MHHPSQQHHQRIILVVEDDPEINLILQTTIRIASGCKVITAFNGSQALDMLDCLTVTPTSSTSRNTDNFSANFATASAKLPVLIVSDIEMPLMDGIQFSQLLHSSPLYRNIPLILLSQSPAELPPNLKPAYFLAKPFSITRVMDVVKEVLKNAGPLNQTIAYQDAPPKPKLLFPQIPVLPSLGQR